MIYFDEVWTGRFFIILSICLPLHVQGQQQHPVVFLSECFVCFHQDAFWLQECMVLEICASESLCSSLPCILPAFFTDPAPLPPVFPSLHVLPDS